MKGRACCDIIEGLSNEGATMWHLSMLMLTSNSSNSQDIKDGRFENREL